MHVLILVLSHSLFEIHSGFFPKQIQHQFDEFLLVFFFPLFCTSSRRLSFACIDSARVVCLSSKVVHLYSVAADILNAVFVVDLIHYLFLYGTVHLPCFDLDE